MAKTKANLVSLWCGSLDCSIVEVELGTKPALILCSSKNLNTSTLNDRPLCCSSSALPAIKFHINRKKIWQKKRVEQIFLLVTAR